MSEERSPLCLATLSAALSISVLLGADPARAAMSFNRGNDWYTPCLNQTQFANNYVQGIVEGMTWEDSKEFCVRPGVNLQQLGDVFCKYVIAHPEIRDRASPWLAVHALKEAFPC